ncbi:LAFE_0H00892g1_1 [Lachancea fermentati]|uniref:Ubiquitin-like modifier-activating enzyme ATG7 n=1 Tax=Lachancea fermentati TaxID=4955 RepID=A0A1G4MJ30_LACFM|nr:LAFE_0H00892g1_1 [Lachancea fermentati]
MSDNTLKFASPCQSFVDTSFFQELSRLKLDVLKLDSERKGLYCTLNLENTPKGASCAHLFLNSQSFDESSSQTSGSIFPGSIYNFNTIEQFKSLDKTQFIQERAQELWISGIQNPNEVVGFSIISFADLKKFKFFYWVCIPCFQIQDPSWKIVLVQKGHLHNCQEYIDWFRDRKDAWSFIIDSHRNVLEFNEKTAIDCAVLGIRDTSNLDMIPSALTKNFISLMKYFRRSLSSLKIYCIRPDVECCFWMDINLPGELSSTDVRIKASGWERNTQNKLTPRAIDLSSLIDPMKVADQSIDLNLKLMKWRIAPELNLDVVKESKILLLGAGTLGCYVARSLLAWGVRKLTFVDNSTVSFSNPVRQPLFNFDDCGQPKAHTAALALKKIFPLVDASGYCLEVPMIGHPVSQEEKQRSDYEQLKELIDNHDVIFLLMDSRETRWLPTVLAYAANKIVINAALGFDSYLVMRHGHYTGDDKKQRLGCYFCQDIVAPSDSLTDRTLDQMCTVTRPGVALMAAAQAVELLVSILQHPQKHSTQASDGILGDIPHQIRGFLSEFKTLQLETPAYEFCSACSCLVIEEFKSRGWEFVKQALNNYKYVEEVCGLTNVQLEAEKMAENVLVDWKDDEDGELI